MKFGILLLLISGLVLSTSVTTCQNITTSGTYILENDLIGANITPIPLRTNGCIVIYSNDVVLDGNGFSIVNNATDDAVGIEINASNVEIKNFKNISAYAFAIFGVTGVNNSIHNSSILFNQVGAAFYQMNNTNIYNNSIINIIDEGIAIGYSHNFSIYDNYFFNMTKAINATSLGNNTYIHNNQFNYTGYAVAIQNSYSNISYNNIFNSTYGIGVLGDSSLSLRNTIISYNNISTIIQYGIQLNTAQNSTVSFNDISNSFAAIISSIDLTGPTLIANVIHNNSFGDTIELSNLSSISYEHYFNNNQDLQLQMSSSDVPLIFNATNIIFDNPSGNFQNYTNISINDVIDPHSRYFFNWSSQPATLNLGDTSFNNKYLNFSSENESKLIDEITWYWSTAEESGYTPTDLRLKFYNGSWQNLSSVPNTMTRTLTATNLNTSGAYSILQVTTPNCPIISSPGIYTMTNNFTGAPNDISEIQAGATTCLKFATSNIDFDCNGYSLTESGAAGLNWAFASNSTGYSNITIRNCRIENYDVGINFQTINNTLIYNNTIFNTVYTPISLNTVNFANISNNNITSSPIAVNRAISLGIGGSGESNIVQNNYVSGAYSGIYMGSINRSNITNNSLNTFSQHGLELNSVNNLTISSNLVSSANNNAIQGTSIVDSLIINNSFTSSSYSLYFSSSPSNDIITNNTFITSNSYGPRYDNGNNLDINHNTVLANGGQIGIWLVSTTNSILDSNYLSEFNSYGLAIEGSTNINITNNQITNTFKTGYGIGIISGSTNAFVSNNTVINQNNGFYITSHSGVYLNNTANGSDTGFNCNSGPTNVQILNSQAFDGTYGFYSSGCSNLNLSSNTVYRVSQYGYYLTSSDNSNIKNSVAYNNSLYGFYIAQSTGTIVRNSLAYNNQYGFFMFGTLGTDDSKQLINNTAYQNQYGAYFQYTTNDYATQNNLYNNTVTGLVFQDNRNLTIVGNEIYNNTLGARIYGATFSSYNGSLTNTHFYNNGNDLQLQSNGGNTLIVSLNGVLFDNPVGNLTAYTNLSINDTVGAGNNYLISWSPGNSMLPANVTSFRQKFVNMTINSGTPSIDQIQWSWTAAEALGYNETNLTIYNYNGTNWTKNGGTLNTGSHTLSLSSLSISNAIYGIMDDEIPIPPPSYLVYFISPTPTNNTNITTSPVVLTLNHINGSVVSPCYFQINGMNQSGTIAGDACSYSFIPTINNTNYNVTGYMNLSGTMVQSNETRTFTWFSTPAPPPPPSGGGGNTGNPVGSGYLHPNQTITNVTQQIVLPPQPEQQYDYKCIGLGILLLALWLWARRKE